MYNRCYTSSSQHYRNFSQVIDRYLEVVGDREQDLGAGERASLLDPIELNSCNTEDFGELGL